MTEERIRTILDTYELPDKTYNRILLRATHSEWCNADMSYLYQRIAWMIENLGVRIPSVDNVINEDDKKARTFLDVCFDAPEVEEEIEWHLGAEDIPFIVARFDQMRQVIPRGPAPGRIIKDITVDPITIDYFRRSFKGNPFNFFIENLDWYEGLSNYRFERLDKSLYQALYNQGVNRLVFSILETLSEDLVDFWNFKPVRLNDKEKLFIKLCHGYFGGFMNETVENLPYHVDTIQDVWFEDSLDKCTSVLWRDRFLSSQFRIDCMLRDVREGRIPSSHLDYGLDVVLNRGGRLVEITGYQCSVDRNVTLQYKPIV